MELQEEILNKIDTKYAVELAKRMEQFRSNEILGYRSAGSAAEFATGELLKAEMEHIGLSDVTKDAITVDGWEFHHAILAYQTAEGKHKEIQLGAYQTTMKTEGFQNFPLIYLGKGTEKEYHGKDVAGKLVLVEINQRDEWWINYPVYQAHLKGAAALIAVQSGGYGEIDDEALNAQDIAGPENAPAFSISRKDAAPLMEQLKLEQQIFVEFSCDTCVMRNCTTYNITGCIPGTHTDRIVLLSAHYDSYFSGFQDDNTAVAMMLGIAKALLDSGYRPRNTIRICAMAAEEWGVADSNFDWSTGAFEQVFTAHPEWVGKVIADLNFELPALAHGTRARIRACYEYVSFLEDYLSDIPNLTRAYPEETRVTAPIETWSDDFSIAIAGIPSMVNDFTGGSFMETHYHSQFDNEDYYDDQVYRLHHELFALLLLALDETAVVPLNFVPVIQRCSQAAGKDQGKAKRGSDSAEAVSAACCNRMSGNKQGAEKEAVQKAASEFQAFCLEAYEEQASAYEKIKEINYSYRRLLREGQEKQAEEVFQTYRDLEKKTLARFRTEQDSFVRIDWYGNVFYPHELLQENIHLLEGTLRNLREGNLSSGLRKLYQVDNNAYAFMFDEEVYRHFTDYVFEQPKERLKWGYGRLVQHENLYELVKQLLQKQESKDTDYAQEITYLEEVCSKQRRELTKIYKELGQILCEHFC